jgi:uncharacterized membrane protein YedE/YeeE
MRALIAALFCGALFGAGMVVSDMINPARVLAFLDVAGRWDYSLALVMGGALAVAAAGYRLVLRSPAPLLSERFQLPSARRIDVRLVGGSALFGVGWGIAGFCPGGALPALGTGKAEVFIFVAALVAGLLIARGLNQLPAFKPQAN